MVAEDDVDAESLQAQVDMTMSLAHNLVTSWIKPSHLEQLRSHGVDATSILEEELRRPPRLGVGASVPSTSPLTHEASKLQRRLGKRNANDQDVAESHAQVFSKPDDEEHKGRPAKRKTKVDPFAHAGSKKKKKAPPHLPVENGLKPPVSLLNGSTLEPLIHNSCSTKERQIGPEDRRSVTTTVPLCPKLSRETSEAPVPGKISAESIGLHANSVPKPDRASIPLLNLDGPPEFSGEPGNGGELENSFKKKRRKRRKKKAKTISGTGDNLH